MARLLQSEDLWLLVDEIALVWFKPDLDASLHFADGLVVLTNRRLLTYEAAPTDLLFRWRSWRLFSR